MTTTYDTALTADKDKVRFWSGDTGSPYFITDEEITYLLTLQSDIYLCAALACDAAYLRAAKNVDFSNMSLSVSASDRAKAFKQAATDLRTGVVGPNTGTAVPIFGGQTISDDNRWRESSSLKQPAFRLDDDQNPYASTVPNRSET